MVKVLLTHGTDPSITDKVILIKNKYTNAYDRNSYP